MTATIATALLLALVLAVLVAALGIKRIPEGQVYTLRRLGRPAGALTAGTHLIVPVVERIAHKISITGYLLVIEEPAATLAASQAHSAPAVRGRIWWQVLDPERADAVIERADDLIRLRLHDELERAEITAPDPRARNQQVKQALNRNLRDRGFFVTRVELDLVA